jgi:outer membrane protein assembly factor BamB
MNRIRIKMVAIASSRQVCLLSIVVLLAAGACFAKPAISLSLTSGPPTSKLLVSGSGFTPYAEIDIYFDIRDEAKATADGSGSFSNISIQAPASALPGRYKVRAVQRSGQLSAQAPFLVNTNWSQFGFRPDGTRYNPYENVLTPSTVGSLGLLWSYTTGGAVQSSPSVAHGVVYAASNDDTTYALNAGTGAVLWSFPLGGEGPNPSSPAVSDGVVYVESLYALNDSTGAVLWSYGSSSNSSPTLANGVIYLGGVDDDYAVNASDGSEVWKVHYGYASASSMAFANGVVYFGTTNGSLYALDISDGNDWICEPPGSGYSSPAVAKGVVYAGAGGGVNAVDAITCAVLWNYTTGGTVASSAAVANGVVYIGSDDNNLYALDAITGSLLWSYSTGGAVTSSPAVAGEVVYFGSGDNKVYALNASTGALLWSYATGGAVETRPAIANGVVYVGSDDGNVYAFGLTGGARRKSSSAKHEAASNPPDLQTLHPDLNLKVSAPVAEGGGAD